MVRLCDKSWSILLIETPYMLTKYTGFPCQIHLSFIKTK